MTWYYDDMGPYKHSFVIMETNDCKLKNHCVFVTEKDKLGVQWYQQPYHDHTVTQSHDGGIQKRRRVTKFQEAEVNMTLGDLKKASQQHTKYHLWQENCHEYAKYLFEMSSNEELGRWDRLMLYMP